MQPTQPEFGTENQALYQVHSRREIINLLSNIGERHQLVSMIIHGGEEVVVTSILEVDDKSDRVILDRAQNNSLNRRILESDNVEFESSLDRVRISFSASAVTECVQSGQPALCIKIPSILIRLQRREHFRVNIPAGPASHCTIPLADRVYHIPMVDISGGGVAILDKQKILEIEPGYEYQDCQIQLPEIGVLHVGLQVRNWQDLSLAHGITNRRLGCQFNGLSPSMLTLVQRYIMQLERERNARLTGMI